MPVLNNPLAVVPSHRPLGPGPSSNPDLSASHRWVKSAATIVANSAVTPTTGFIVPPSERSKDATIVKQQIASTALAIQTLKQKTNGTSKNRHLAAARICQTKAAGVKCR